MKMKHLILSVFFLCSIAFASSMGGFGGGGGSWGSITGTLTDQGDLNTALGLKAPLASPTFTGVVTVPAGSAGAPSYTFSDSDNGLFLAGTNVPAIASAATKMFEVDSANNRVAVRPGSGQTYGSIALLDAYTTTMSGGASGVTLTTDASSLILSGSSGVALKTGGTSFFDGTTARLLLSAPIRPNSPSARVIGAQSNTHAEPFDLGFISALGMGYADDTTPIPTIASGVIQAASGTSLALKTEGADNITLGTNATTRLTIDSSGNSTFTGSIRAPDGAVGTPSITFSSDTDTGWYWTSSGVMKAAINGSQLLQISSGGLLASTGAFLGFGTGAAAIGHSGTDDLDLYGDNVVVATASGTALTVKKILSSTAGTAITPTSYSGNQTLVATETYARYTGSGGHTFTLPSATGAGTVLIIKHKGSGNLTVSRAGSDTIDGNTSVILNTGDSLLLIDGATNSWEIN